MDKQQNFKFIKGVCCAGSPADICFYTDVDYWSVDDFLREFDYLINWINPSKIRIHINSVGGSVIDGMSVFAKIQNCNIPTECINDALAASMGSIIWAAGDELYMKDYALLMIHNPFCDVDGDKQYNQATEAFTKQLKTIYMKRFGLVEEEVEKIMNGKEGEDGTFLTASEAVEKGFIKEDHIIETPSAIKDKIQAALNNSKDVAHLKAVYNLAIPALPAATVKDKNIKSNLNTMEDNKVTVFAALFGLTGDKATSENVTAKINELKAQADKAVATQKTLDETKAELDRVNAELTGAQTSVKNLNSDLATVKAELKKYQDAENEAREAKVTALIDKAIEECKINKDERDAYTEMARNNFELAENVLSKIPAREKLSDATAKGQDNNKVQAEMKSEEAKIAEKVKAVVGDNFKFRSLN